MEDAVFGFYRASVNNILAKILLRSLAGKL